MDRCASFDARGWLRQGPLAVRHVASPNRDARPVDVDATLIVIHGISLPPGVFGGREVEALFTNRMDCDAHPYFASLRGLEVSSHFFVRRDGELIQFVAVDERAWHAGVSSFEGRSRCNDFSIGIELEGTDTGPYEPEQYRSLIALVDGLASRWPIVAIAGHADVAPGRKTDPGPHFDWHALHRGLARPLAGPHARAAPAVDRIVHSLCAERDSVERAGDK